MGLEVGGAVVGNGETGDGVGFFVGARVGRLVGLGVGFGVVGPGVGAFVGVRVG